MSKKADCPKNEPAIQRPAAPREVGFSLSTAPSPAMQRPPKPKATPCSLSPSFEAAHLNHLSAPPTAGTGAWDTLTPDDFARAITEISGWHGYAPTPLHPLQGLAQALSLGEVLYKHEGPRFGIGSFKALGAAYAGLCVLQTNSQIPLAA